MGLNKLAQFTYNFSSDTGSGAAGTVILGNLATDWAWRAKAVRVTTAGTPAAGTFSLAMRDPAIILIPPIQLNNAATSLTTVGVYDATRTAVHWVAPTGTQTGTLTLELSTCSAGVFEFILEGTPLDLKNQVTYPTTAGSFA